MRYYELDNYGHNGGVGYGRPGYGAAQFPAPSDYDRGHNAGKAAATALGTAAVAGLVWWFLKKLDDRND